MKRILSELLVGAVCAAIAYKFVAEIYLRFITTSGYHYMAGFFIGMPIGSLVGIMIVDRLAFRSACLNRLYSEVAVLMGLVLSLLVIVGTILYTSMSIRVACSLPITVSCACIAARWVAMRLQYAMRRQ